jgi:hypothetical protein
MIKMLLPQPLIRKSFPFTLKVANLTYHNVIIPLQGVMHKEKQSGVARKLPRSWKSDQLDQMISMSIQVIVP